MKYDTHSESDLGKTGSSDAYESVSGLLWTGCPVWSGVRTAQLVFRFDVLSPTDY